MDIQQANSVFKRVFMGDTILNWMLGILLVLLARIIDGILGQSPILPVIVYQVIGAIFLLYAAWQTLVLVRRQIGPGGLIFAAVMAEAPVLILTIALLFMALPLKPAWRIILWVGNIYMLGLGAWYLSLTTMLRRRQEPALQL